MHLIWINKAINPDNDDPSEEYLTAVAYREDIKKRKQERICKSNVHENSNRIDHDFKKSDWVTLIKPGQITQKLLLPQEGPYKVV